MATSHRRLLAAEASESHARFDARRGRFQLRDGSPEFVGVRLLGVCTRLARLAQCCELQIANLFADAAELRVGELASCVDCLGTLAETANRSRWIDATHLAVLRDPNTESLRMLEILQLRQEHGTKTRAPDAAQFALLPFPSALATSAGAKRKHAFASPTASRQRTASEQSPQPVLIEKPREQPARQQQQLQQQRPAPQQLGIPSSNASIPVRASVLPPAEYQFNVSPTDQQDIESGAKTLEIRLNAAPYSIIHVNDSIVINGRTAVVVSAVRKYASLQTVLQMESLANLLPAAASASNTVNASAVAMRHFRQFLSPAEEAINGLVVFELRVGGSSAPQVPEKSAGEWSQLLYEQLDKKRSYGCSLADLQFAFPALPVDQIIQILSDMQMDGVVYAIQDKYLLL